MRSSSTRLRYAWVVVGALAVVALAGSGVRAAFGVFIKSPPPPSLTTKIYGRYSVGELSGWIFFSSQIGSAVGALVGGHLYDRLGDHTGVFHSAGSSPSRRP